MIISRTPHRVSLVGGGTDFPAWYNENGGAVLGFALAKYCYISLRSLPAYATSYKHRIVYSKIELVNEYWEIDHPAVAAVLADQCVEEGLDIHHAGDVPARAGLGSSSAFTVGLLHALSAHRGKMVSRDYLAREAIRIEQDVIHEAVGSQDQCFAAFGSFNRIDFDATGFRVRKLILPPGRTDQVLGSLLLVFTGLQRVAAELEARKIATIHQHAAALHQLTSLVGEVESALTAQKLDLRELGNILHESWEIKRSLAEGVSWPDLDALYDRALEHGALGGKLLGSGAGGCLLLVVPPEQRAALKDALGLIEIPLVLDQDGSRIMVFEPNGLGR